MFKLICVLFIIISRPLPFAEAGTVDGGGGNLAKSPVHPLTVKQLVSELKPYLYDVFNYWEIMNDLGREKGNGTSDLETLTSKLFESPDGYTIFNALNEAKFVVYDDQGCIDLNGQENDASAFNSNPNEICFSLKRLSQKLENNNYFLPMLALAAHELSHKLGVDEKEAQLFQLLILRTVPGTFEFNRMRERDEIETKINTILKRRIRDVKQEIKEGHSQISRCLSIQTLRSEMEFLEERFLLELSLGSTVLGATSFKSMVAASSKASSALGYCGEESLPDKQKLKSYFKGQDRMLLTDLMKASAPSPAATVLDFGNHWISYVAYDDLTYLKLEIDEIEEIFKNLSKAMVSSY